MKTPYSGWEHARRRRALMYAALGWALIIASGLVMALAIFGLLVLAAATL